MGRKLSLYFVIVTGVTVVLVVVGRSNGSMVIVGRSKGSISELCTQEVSQWQAVQEKSARKSDTKEAN